MGFKHKVVLVTTFVLLLSIILALIIYIVALGMTQRKEAHYTNTLLSVLTEQEKTTAQDIFSFEFDRAYVFNDCYISGDGLAQKYNLDISIGEVKTGSSENIQRIVFVDKSGNFVYEFRCDVSEVVFPQEGVILYPETVIERKAFDQDNRLILGFQNAEHYDS